MRIVLVSNYYKRPYKLYFVGNDATAMVVDFLVGPVKANDDKETFSCFVCLSDCCCLEIGFIAAENESIFSSAAMLSKGKLYTFLRSNWQLMYLV